MEVGRIAAPCTAGPLPECSAKMVKVRPSSSR
jgi:hypothetical protein